MKETYLCAAFDRLGEHERHLPCFGLQIIFHFNMSVNSAIAVIILVDFNAALRSAREEDGVKHRGHKSTCTSAQHHNSIFSLKTPPVRYQLSASP